MIGGVACVYVFVFGALCCVYHIGGLTGATHSAQCNAPLVVGYLRCFAHMIAKTTWSTPWTLPFRGASGAKSYVALIFIRLRACEDLSQIFVFAE